MQPHHVVRDQDKLIQALGLGASTLLETVLNGSKITAEEADKRIAAAKFLSELFREILANRLQVELANYLLKNHPQPVTIPFPVSTGECKSSLPPPSCGQADALCKPLLFPPPADPLPPAIGRYRLSLPMNPVSHDKVGKAIGIKPKRKPAKKKPKFRENDSGVKFGKRKKPARRKPANFAKGPFDLK